MSPMAFALKLLGMRSHSRDEIRRKLLKKGYVPEDIEAVVERLKSQGLLDDRIFGTELIKSRSRRKPLGKLKMRAELGRKGVPDNVISELLQDYESLKLCQQAAERKIRSLRSTTDEARQKKLETFLHNRGFEWHEIQIVTRRLFGESEDFSEPC